jgi:hypothetical protein
MMSSARMVAVGFQVGLYILPRGELHVRVTDPLLVQPPDVRPQCHPAAIARWAASRSNAHQQEAAPDL